MEAVSMLEKSKDEGAIRGYAILAKGDKPKQLKENVFRVDRKSVV